MQQADRCLPAVAREAPWNRHHAKLWSADDTRIESLASNLHSYHEDERQSYSSLQPTFSLFFLMCFSTWCSLATTSPLLADFFLGSPGRASMWLSSTLCSRQAPNQSCAGKD